MTDDQQPLDEPPDAAGPPADRSGADDTREIRPVAAEGDTEVRASSGAPRGGDTSVLPAVPTWSGRAGVPPPDAVVVREAVPVEEEPAAERRWWLPVVLALLALALLALLGIGLWLVTRGDGGANPVAPVTTSVTPGGPSSNTPGTPTEATTTQTPSQPAQVMVPRLVGMDSDTAQSILDRLGLTYRLTGRTDPDARPGTVLETDPAEGSVVSEGTQITLVIASAPPSPATPSPAPPSPASPSPTV